jgi:hypothetical protein
MKFGELPRLYNALTLMGLDNGASPNPSAVIPADWEARAKIAEDELLLLTQAETEDLVYGEEGDQKKIAPRAPTATEILDAAFDGGPLGDVVFVAWSSIFHARAAEAEYRARRQTGTDA